MSFLREAALYGGEFDLDRPSLGGSGLMGSYLSEDASGLGGGRRASSDTAQSFGSIGSSGGNSTGGHLPTLPYRRTAPPLLSGSDLASGLDGITGMGGGGVRGDLFDTGPTPRGHGETLPLDPASAGGTGGSNVRSSGFESSFGRGGGAGKEGKSNTAPGRYTPLGGLGVGSGFPLGDVSGLSARGATSPPPSLRSGMPDLNIPPGMSRPVSCSGFPLLPHPTVAYRPPPRRHTSLHACTPAHCTFARKPCHLQRLGRTL